MLNPVPFIGEWKDVRSVKAIPKAKISIYCFFPRYNASMIP